MAQHDRGTRSPLDPARAWTEHSTFPYAGAAVSAVAAALVVLNALAFDAPFLFALATVSIVRGANLWWPQTLEEGCLAHRLRRAGSVFSVVLLVAAVPSLLAWAARTDVGRTFLEGPGPVEIGSLLAAFGLAAVAAALSLRLEAT